MRAVIGMEQWRRQQPEQPRANRSFGWLTRLVATVGPAAAVLALGLVNAVVGTALLARVARVRGDGAGLELGVGAVVAVFGVGISAWWVLSLVVTVAAELRRRTTDRRGLRAPVGAPGPLSPAFMRRLVGALLSAQLVAGTATAAAASSPAVIASGSVSSVTSSASATAGLARTDSSRFLPSVTVPAGPDGRPAPTPASDADPWFIPRPPALQDGTLLVRPPSRADGDAATVTVVTGDTLWSLAARQLGPLATDLEIARQWPRWHALNSAVIGPDPSVIRPGQVLRVPEGDGQLAIGAGR